MKETILHSVARILASIFVTHNPGENYRDFTFGGISIGLPEDEYIVVKIYRRKYADHTRKTDPAIVTVTPEIIYT